MRYAYVTLDEVNQNLAERLARKSGIELDVLALNGAAPAAPFDAVLYDLDFLPPDLCQTILADLELGRSIEPVAVHSYKLSVRQVWALRRQGVIVARRLRSAVFAQLQAAVAARRASKAEASVV